MSLTCGSRGIELDVKPGGKAGGYSRGPVEQAGPQVRIGFVGELRNAAGFDYWTKSEIGSAGSGAA
jgi:hypothetical protein